MNTNEDKIFIAISDSDLSVAGCRDLVAGVEFGGIVIFEGSVRNQTKGKEVLKLEFEAYNSMAEKEMNNIAKEALLKFEIGKICIHHRVGVLEPGELPVVIAVSAPHRNAAFEACKFAIDELKERVPIWKKEIFKDGEVWVAAHP